MSIKSLNSQDLLNIGSNVLKAGVATIIGFGASVVTIKICYTILNRSINLSAGIASQQTIKHKKVNRYSLYAKLINIAAVTTGSLANIVFAKRMLLSHMWPEVINISLLNNSLFTGKKTWYFLGIIGAFAGLIAIPSDESKRGPGFSSHARNG